MVSAMIARLLALLAVVALFAAPLNAAAAQAACDGMASGQMVMVSVDGGTATAPSPCCDPHKGAKHHDRSCLSNCVTMSGALAALASPTPPVVVAWIRFDAAPLRAMAIRAHDPPTLRRPPKQL
jgi:hypothetical protein